MPMEIQILALDMHTNMTELNRLIGPHVNNGMSNSITDINKKASKKFASVEKTTYYQKYMDSTLPDSTNALSLVK